MIAKKAFGRLLNDVEWVLAAPSGRLIRMVTGQMQWFTEDVVDLGLSFDDEFYFYVLKIKNITYLNRFYF